MALRTVSLKLTQCQRQRPGMMMRKQKDEQEADKQMGVIFKRSSKKSWEEDAIGKKRTGATGWNMVWES